jgi:hypothetical protein
MVGEVGRTSGGHVVVNRNVRKCLGVGEKGSFISQEDRDKWDEHENGFEDPSPPPRNRLGFLWFGLDFSDRGVVQHSQTEKKAPLAEKFGRPTARRAVCNSILQGGFPCGKEMRDER